MINPAMSGGQIRMAAEDHKTLQQYMDYFTRIIIESGSPLQKEKAVSSDNLPEGAAPEIKWLNYIAGQARHHLDAYLALFAADRAIMLEAEPKSRSNPSGGKTLDSVVAREDPQYVNVLKAKEAATDFAARGFYAALGMQALELLQQDSKAGQDGKMASLLNLLYCPEEYFRGFGQHRNVETAREAVHKILSCQIKAEERHEKPSEMHDLRMLIDQKLTGLLPTIDDFGYC